eukprot:100026-Hanusia_phi.AAC.1
MPATLNRNVSAAPDSVTLAKLHSLACSTPCQDLCIDEIPSSGEGFSQPCRHSRPVAQFGRVKIPQ